MKTTQSNNDIEFNNLTGTYSFVENTRNAIAWHRLGKRFDTPLTSAEAITACNADFQVTKQPILALSKELTDLIDAGEYIDPALLQDLIIKGKVATMRDDNNETLGIVSESYGVVQNKDAFSFVDKIITGDLTDESKGAEIECAGLLGSGEKVFITVKFPDSIKLDDEGKDVIDMYLVFTTSHDGTGAVKCMVTPVRAISNATLNFAFPRATGRISLRHSSNVLNRMDLTNLENAHMAYSSLKMFNEYRDQFEAAVKELQQKVLTMPQIEDVVAYTLFSEEQFKIWKETRDLDADGISTNAKNKFNKAIETICTSGVGQMSTGAARNTGLWVINGLTTLYQNGFKPANDEVFFNSMMDGYIYGKIQKAYQAILKA